MVADKPYGILITGVGISGKTNLATSLEKDLKEYSVTNKDVDWDNDALIIPSTEVYILQTPKGCEIERIHQISPSNFNKILYCDPSIETYLELLTSRACAWFKEGIAEKGLDTNPTPYSYTKLPKIIKRVINYATTRETLREKDMLYFNNSKSKLRILNPKIIESDKLQFTNYSKTLEEILKEVIANKNGN